MFNWFKKPTEPELSDYQRYDLEIVTKADSHAILQPLVMELLGAEGFEAVAPMVWLRNTDAPIRQIFCFKPWKGGALAPSWGLSLDFVPHISGGRVKWHRTPNSAMQDLVIDSRERAWDVTYHHGVQRIQERAPAVVRSAIPTAQAFWNKYRTIDSLLAAFQWTKQYYEQHRGLGFYHMTQHPLALAFVYAKSGDWENAIREFEEHGPALDADEDEKLRKLFLAAAGQA